MIKYIVLISISLCVVTSAFAGSTITMADKFTSSGLSIYGDKTNAKADNKSATLIAKTSTGVGVGMFSNATGYSVITQHKNGTKAFGTYMDSTSIFSKSVEAGIATKGPESADSTFFTGDWTSM